MGNYWGLGRRRAKCVPTQQEAWATPTTRNDGVEGGKFVNNAQSSDSVELQRVLATNTAAACLGVTDAFQQFKVTKAPDISKSIDAVAPRDAPG